MNIKERYKESLEYLEKSYGQINKKGLPEIRAYLDELGNPQDRMKIIHVAGTNGKGSVCKMINDILCKSNYKVGLFISPHLFKFNERIQINNIAVSDEDFVAALDKIRGITEKFYNEKEPMLSFFEIIMLMAFYYFGQNDLDYLVLETGLGGLLDSTNVIKKPVLTVITSISLDHTDILGDNILEIAAQKAGIIKENCPVVVAKQETDVKNIIKRTAEGKNAPFYSAYDETEIEISKMDLSGTVFSIRHRLYAYDKILLRLLGEYQIENAALVLLSIFVLNKNGAVIPEKALYESLSETKWRGRMEYMVYKGKRFILDGAHNFDAILKLEKSIEIYLSNKKIIMILGILADKEHKKMLETAKKIADTIILTKPDNKRALKPEGLGENILIEENYKEAVSKAVELADEDSFIIVCGSLYLISDIAGYIGRKEND